eukprot:34087-Pyramimonas_sp.AAC.1
MKSSIHSHLHRRSRHHVLPPRLSIAVVPSKCACCSGRFPGEVIQRARPPPGGSGSLDDLPGTIMLYSR